ncbi:antitoxin VbhA family protein [Microbacterium luticocti]|uniref:antitoxin VbhA family protein n=1 Tax=Microbacterium luticocti TaxID=451764 RepID=UPI000400A3BA|nr:antitoxin VbhA family protein [Microbacterium luticocti]
MSLTTITAAERAEREKAVTAAIHSGEMEGLPMTEATRADTADYVAGEIDLDQLEARVRSRYGIE